MSGTRRIGAACDAVWDAHAFVLTHKFSSQVVLTTLSAQWKAGLVALSG